MPPDNFPAGRSRNSYSPVLLVRSSMRLRLSVRLCPNNRATNCRFSSTDRFWTGCCPDLEACRQYADKLFCDVSGQQYLHQARSGGPPERPWHRPVKPANWISPRHPVISPIMQPAGSDREMSCKAWVLPYFRLTCWISATAARQQIVAS